MLDRVDFSFAERVINPIYPETTATETDSDTHPSTKLFWLFGRGVPREVKRNVRICLEDELMPRMVDRMEVWQLLLSKRLQDLKSLRGSDRAR